MMIYTRTSRSKPKKSPKNVREQHESWLNSVQSMKTNFSFDKRKSYKTTSSITEPYRRETPHYPSVSDGIGNCTKPINPITYTGTNLIGIGTLHKSNAVPIFNSQDAVDIAKMRRN